MADIDDFLAERHRRRWMQPNAHLYLRPDAVRWLTPDELKLYDPPPYDRTRKPPPAVVDHDEAEIERERRRLRWQIAALRFHAALIRHALCLRKANFNPAQPRDELGRWTDTGGGINDPRVISDATPDNDWKPDEQYAQNRNRGPITVRIGDRSVEIEGGQAARLVEAQTRANAAIARVRELDPTWKPRPSAHETPEGLIRTFNAEAAEAEARLGELGGVGIGPGPFAAASELARGPGRDARVEETLRNNANGNRFGCHTCGTSNPGTISGNWVRDHQDPSALNLSGRPQRIYPQCLSCSLRQGGWVRSLQRRR